MVDGKFASINWLAVSPFIHPAMNMLSNGVILDVIGIATLTTLQTAQLRLPRVEADGQRSIKARDIVCTRTSSSPADRRSKTTTRIFSDQDTTLERSNTTVQSVFRH